MTRILYWNIEKFASNKIANPSTKRTRGGALKANQKSVERLNYINLHWALTDNLGAVSPPDIIVVVEVSTAYDGRGNLVRGAGATGSQTLLTAIRATTGNAHWMLVPPLQTGPREAVAVYFDSSNYAFTGPWHWPGGVGPATAPAAMGPPPVAYAAPFGALLPGTAAPVGGANAGTPQNRLAAATDFTFAAAHANAGAAAAFGTMRAPYWVSFAELTAGGLPVARNISLFCIHSPASAVAGAYLAALNGLAEIADGIAADEVRVVLGDFNVNLLNNDGARTRNASYAALAGGGYALGIDRPGNPPAPINGWLGYFATHIKRGSKSTYWSTAAKTDYYPGYGYVGSSIVPNLYSIDNILARYGAGAGGPMANVTVVNGIVGSRYDVIAPAPGNPPTGAYDLPIHMAGVPFAAAPPQAPAFSVGRRSAFNGWINYGRIRSTSDHLAIVADI